MGSYDHRSFERKWSEAWESAGVHRWRNDRTRPKQYILEMFPYTSGRLHMGHVRNYTMGDTLARMRRAQGYDVLYPMGWDAFGLPAENAAIRSGIHPRRYTEQAIASMKGAMKTIGLSYDWSREVDTSSPAYIRAQQVLFLRFFEKGLLHRDTSFVNWCESCVTVLADEQAASGRCWRCGTPVSKRRVPQWFMNIRSYADELLDGLDRLPDWPDSVKNIQRTWIGRSEGTEIDFPLDGEDEVLRVFTTRVDTLAGCTFLALAPEHELLDRLEMPADARAQVDATRERILSQSTEERSSREAPRDGAFTGRWAISPISGERVPILVASYVLTHYGTGAIMAVPAHDQRDFEFAKQHHLPIRIVIAGGGVSPATNLESAYVEDGHLVNSGPFDGLDCRAAFSAITAALTERGSGRRAVQYRLQDWSVSRQRYWGNPIPIIHCSACGPVPVPDVDLPVRLPENLEFDGKGSPLARSRDYMDVSCPRCGGAASRDPDTMDTFFDSSWYFLRFPTPEAEAPVDPAIVERMLPVDSYVGGIEHATLHLMYARFFVKALRDLGIIRLDEPFSRLFNHGMVNDAEGRKQSKSLGNVVEPHAVIETYGADALRVYLMFATAYNAAIDWSDTGPEDARAWLNRVHRLGERLRRALAGCSDLRPDPALCRQGAARALRRDVHETILKVTSDIERFQFNTAVASLMSLTNSIYAYPAEAPQEPAAGAYRVLVRLLGVVAPFLAEDIWSWCGPGGLLPEQPWPGFEPDAVDWPTKEIAVQVNGRFVLSIQVPREAAAPDIQEAALRESRVRSRIGAQSLRRVIHVPDRLVNLVLS